MSTDVKKWEINLRCACFQNITCFILTWWVLWYEGVCFTFYCCFTGWNNFSHQWNFLGNVSFKNRVDSSLPFNANLNFHELLEPKYWKHQPLLVATLIFLLFIRRHGVCGWMYLSCEILWPHFARIMSCMYWIPLWELTM